MIEMLDAMKASLENAKKVKSEQELLIKVLKESEYVETFKEFIESEEKAHGKHIDEQLREYIERSNEHEKER